MRFPGLNNIFMQIPNHVALKIALELKKLLIDNSLLDVYVAHSAVSKFLFPTFVTSVTYDSLNALLFQKYFAALSLTLKLICLR